MPKSAVAFVILSLSIMSTASWAGPKPRSVSWGRSNISFATYRQDTLDCANQTYGLDVSMKPETAQALGASNSASLYEFLVSSSFYRSGSYKNGEEGYHAVMSSIEPDHAVFRNTTYISLFRNAARTDVVDQLQAVLDYCLKTRGYHRFRLTDGQRHALSGYKRGSGERARYLYTLGSDPAVLAAQTD